MNSPTIIQIGASYHIYGYYRDFFGSSRLFPLPIKNLQDHVIRCHRNVYYNVSANSVVDIMSVPALNPFAGAPTNNSQSSVCFASSDVPSPIPLQEGSVFPLGNNPNLWFASTQNVFGSAANFNVYFGFVHIEICPRCYNLPNPFKASRNMNAASIQEVGFVPDVYSWSLIAPNSAPPGTFVTLLPIIFASGQYRFVLIDIYDLKFSAYWKAIAESGNTEPCRIYLLTGNDAAGSGGGRVLHSNMFPVMIDPSTLANTAQSINVNWSFDPPITGYAQITPTLSAEPGRLIFALENPWDIDGVHLSYTGAVSIYPGSNINLLP